MMNLDGFDEKRESLYLGGANYQLCSHGRCITTDIFFRFDTGIYEGMMSLGVERAKDEVGRILARQLTKVTAMADVFSRPHRFPTDWTEVVNVRTLAGQITRFAAIADVHAFYFPTLSDPYTHFCLNLYPIIILVQLPLYGINSTMGGYLFYWICRFDSRLNGLLHCVCPAHLLSPVIC